MRTELYEEYKQEHPEELDEVNRVFDYDRSVRDFRAGARAKKLEKVRKWRRILDGDDYTGRGE